MERHRIVVAIAIAVVPVAGLIGFGCSDDEPAGAGITVVDPGGTFGAEVYVRVVGRGHVTGNIAGSIDCPRDNASASTGNTFPQTQTADCYVRYTFASPTDKGASDGLTLKAVASDGARFLGWKFDSEQIGTKGRGPDNCNPVKRATTQPGDSNSPELKLPFGEMQGTAPAGQEGACGGDFLKVPLAYKLVASFEEIPVFDGGPDTGGDAGGPGELLFDQPMAGATGGDLFILSNRLYWRFNANGYQGIATGLTSAFAPAAPTVAVSPSGFTIPRFEGDYQNVLFQTSLGTIGVFNTSSGASPNTGFSTPPSACDGLESYYSSSTLYCLSSGTIYSWPVSGGTRTTVTSSVPATSGRPMAATFSYFWIINDPGTTNGASIQRSTRVDSDGGVATWDPVITGETNPIKLFVNSNDYLAWIKYNASSDVGEVHTSTGSATVYIPVPARASLKFVAPDYSSSSIIAASAPPSGVGGMIFQSSFTSSPSTITPVVQNIPNLTGIAADSSYFYWTQNDGRVYRKSKF